MADSTPKSYATDPTLYLYTSLSSGSSHIVTATSRLETILKANKVPFRALDVATDEKARMLWGRRAGKRKLPGLVRMGVVVGDLDEVEEWNEYGEIQEQLGSGPQPSAAASTPGVSATNTPSKASAPPRQTAQPSTPSKPAATTTKSTTPSTPSKPTDAAAKPSADAKDTEKPKQIPGNVDSSVALAMRQAGSEAAARAVLAKKAKLKPQAGPSSATANAAAKAATDASAEPSDVESKLDQSVAPGIAPPSGETEAKDAIAPETEESTAESKADSAPITTSAEAEQSTTANTVDADAAAPSIAVTDTSSVDSHKPPATTSPPARDPPSVGGMSTTHRGSSFSSASREQVNAIEAVTKIEEDPEAEAAEATGVKAAAPKGEQHVTFGGEEPGKEIDKVKATLSASGEALEGCSPKAAAGNSRTEAESAKQAKEDGKEAEGGKSKVKSKLSAEESKDAPAAGGAEKPTGKLAQPATD